MPSPAYEGADTALGKFVSPHAAGPARFYPNAYEACLAAESLKFLATALAKDARGREETLGVSLSAFLALE